MEFTTQLSAIVAEGGTPRKRGRNSIVVTSLALAAALVAATAGVVSAGSQGCTPPPGSLEAWWAGDGDATDMAGDHDSTLIGGADFAPGIVDLAFDLDGVDDYVYSRDRPVWTLGDDAFTIDAWVNFASLPGRASSIVSHTEGAGEVNKWIFWFDKLGHEGQPATHSGSSSTVRRWAPSTPSPRSGPPPSTIGITWR